MSRVCIGCGTDIADLRRGAKYCENSCKMVMYRERKKAAKAAKPQMPSRTESQLAYLIKWVDFKSAAGIKQADQLDSEAAYQELRRLVVKFIGLTSEARVASVLALDEEEEGRDPEAYYKRTGLF